MVDVIAKLKGLADSEQLESKAGCRGDEDTWFAGRASHSSELGAQQENAFTSRP